MHTPYGRIHTARHLYQSSRGGKTFCPADTASRLVSKATPRLAKLLTADYCCGPAAGVVDAFASHHQVKVSKDLVRETSRRVSEQLIETETKWHYALPASVWASQVHHVSVSRDGAMLHLLDGLPPRRAGWREAMCGVICLYDAVGTLLHSIYVGVAPQKGKADFTALFEQEVLNLKTELERRQARPLYIGLADGAADHWPQLERLTDVQLTDYYHVSQRLHRLAEVLPLSSHGRADWLSEQKRCLLEEPQGAEQVLAEAQRATAGLTDQAARQCADEQITYLRRQQARMGYAQMRRQGLPVGSGTVEAGCKTLIKQRMGGSGMRWLHTNADQMLAVRALYLTPGRYEQYWKKRMRYAA